MKAWPEASRPPRFGASRRHEGPALRPEDVFGPAPTAVSAPAPAGPRQPLSPRERAAVLARIQSLIDFWGITPDELAAEPEPAPAPVAAPVVAVRYRHPLTGDTWDGQGPHPDWLRKALLKEGYRVDELRPPESSSAAA